MSEKNINFDDKKNLKSDFYTKKVAKVDDIDVNKVLVSKEKPYGKKDSFKYFIRYIDNNVIRPSFIKLPQMTGYVKKFEGNTKMSFKINNEKLLKKCNQIWKRVEKLLKIEFDSKRVLGSDDNNYIRIKLIIYGGEMFRNFWDKKIPKEKVTCKCLTLISIDSVIKAKKKYYPQTLLEKCKYKQKKIKIENLTDEDLEKSESTESDSDSNDETE